MILNEKPSLSANVLWISSSESSGRFAGTGSVSQNWANEACDGLPPHYGQHHWWEDPGESLCQEEAREDGHSQKYVAGAENATLPTFGFNEINQIFLFKIFCWLLTFPLIFVLLDKFKGSKAELKQTKSCVDVNELVELLKSRDYDGYRFSYLHRHKTFNPSRSIAKSRWHCPDVIHAVTGL